MRCLECIAPNPGGAFYAIAKLPIDDSDKFCQWLLESFSYKNQTVMLAPAYRLLCNKGLGKDEVRLAYVLNAVDLEKAMDCLEKALEEYNNSADGVFKGHLGVFKGA